MREPEAPTWVIPPPPGAPPTATVVVLCYRPEPWLVASVHSALEQDAQVLLIDNGSDGAAASEMGAPTGAAVLRSEHNLGFAGGVNLGLRHAGGRLVALLNDDAVAAPGWIASAAGVLEDPAVAAVMPKVRIAGWFRGVGLGDERTPAPGDHRRLGTRLTSVTAGGREVLAELAGGGIHRIEGGEGSPWRWTVPGVPFYVPASGPDDAGAVTVNGAPAEAGRPLRLINKAGTYLRADGILGDYASETPDDGRFDQPRECFFASGTAMVATAATFRAVGGLADRLFAYYEDGDWSWRARLLGLRVLYDPSSTVDHRVSATSGGPVSARVRFLAERNRSLCMVRNAPAPVAAAEIRRRVGGGPLDGVRRGVLEAMPWALRTRAAIQRRATVDPRAVWDRWAGTGTDWDGAPPE